MGGHTVDHVAQVSERVDLVALAGSDKAVEGEECLAMATDRSTKRANWLAPNRVLVYRGMHLRKAIIEGA